FGPASASGAGYSSPSGRPGGTGRPRARGEEQAPVREGTARPALVAERASRAGAPKSTDPGGTDERQKSGVSSGNSRTAPGEVALPCRKSCPAARFRWVQQGGWYPDRNESAVFENGAPASGYGCARSGPGASTPACGRGE